MSVDSEFRAGGVIHDIGYRHYDQPRLSPSVAARSLGVDSLRGAFGLGRSGRSKIAPMLLLGVCCLPAIVMVVAVHLTGTDRLPVRYTDYPQWLYAVVALFVAGPATAAVSRDLRFRVLSLYFSRPISRRAYVS